LEEKGQSEQLELLLAELSISEETKSAAISDASPLRIPLHEDQLELQTEVLWYRDGVRYHSKQRVKCPLCHTVFTFKGRKTHINSKTCERKHQERMRLLDATLEEISEENS
jgi:hypothetical protein